MASSSHRGGAAPYRSREGLSTRSGTNTDEIQLRIDPMHSDLDDHISGLHSQVRMLRNEIVTREKGKNRGYAGRFNVVHNLSVDCKAWLQVAQEIESEAKYQNDAITKLQMMLIKAQAGVKNNVRKLNKSIIQQGSSHVVHVVLFALVLFFIVYLLSKMSHR